MKSDGRSGNSNFPADCTLGTACPRLLENVRRGCHTCPSEVRQTSPPRISGPFAFRPVLQGDLGASFSQTLIEPATFALSALLSRSTASALAIGYPTQS